MSLNLSEALRTQDEDLFHAFSVTKQAISKCAFCATPVGYTDHGEHHLEAVEGNVAELLGKAGLCQLTTIELYILLVSIWLHDIGRIADLERMGPDEHAALGESLIWENREALSLNKVVANVVGSIVHAHGMPWSEVSSWPHHVIVRNSRIRLHLLCALLRLGDVLDIRRERAPELAAFLQRPSPSSINHWKAHETIGGAVIDQQRGIIEIGLFVENREEFRLASLIVESVRQEFATCAGALAEIGLAYEYVIENVDGFTEISDSPEQATLDLAVANWLSYGWLLMAEQLQTFSNCAGKLIFELESKKLVVASSILFKQGLARWKPLWGSDEVASIIFDLQNSAETDVAAAAIRSYEDAMSIDRLCILFGHKSHVVRLAVLDKAASLQIDLLPLINAALSDSEASVRLRALSIVKKMNLEQEIDKELLFHAADDPHPDVREATARLLGPLLPLWPEARQLLDRLAKDRFGRVRHTARKIIGDVE